MAAREIGLETEQTSVEADAVIAAWMPAVIRLQNAWPPEHGWEH
jgi:hypothetical protein